MPIHKIKFSFLLLKKSIVNRDSDGNIFTVLEDMAEFKYQPHFRVFFRFKIL